MLTNEQVQAALKKQKLNNFINTLLNENGELKAHMKFQENKIVENEGELAEQRRKNNIICNELDMCRLALEQGKAKIKEQQATIAALRKMLHIQSMNDASMLVNELLESDDVRAVSTTVNAECAYTSSTVTTPASNVPTSTASTPILNNNAIDQSKQSRPDNHQILAFSQNSCSAARNTAKRKIDWVFHEQTVHDYSTDGKLIKDKKRMVFHNNLFNSNGK